MNEPLSLVFALIAGMMFGAIFFGGLWWTVRKGVAAKRPALWFMASMVLRTGIVVTGFYFVLGDDWRKLLVGLFGFIVARSVSIRLAQQKSGLTGVASHAP
ncbi:MAG: ATP synthase subunit I [Sideroxydans sp.]|jgi:F1F0 ATPase subunit 2